MSRMVRLPFKLQQTTVMSGQVRDCANGTLPSASEVRSADVIAGSLSRQVCSSVRWTESIQKLISAGVQLFVEVGPGKVLCGLIRQIDRAVRTANVEDPPSLAHTLETVKSLG